MESILFPWMAEVVLISWRSVRNRKRPPLPSEFLASFVIFGTFSLVAVKSDRVASVLGWGVVIATGLNFFPSYTGVPNGKPGPNLAPYPGQTVGNNIRKESAPVAAPSALNQYPGGI